MYFLHVCNYQAIIGLYPVVSSLKSCLHAGKMFEDLHDPVLFDVIVDCLVNFLRQPITLSFPNTVWDIIAKVAQLQPMLGQALQSDDMGICQGLSRIPARSGSIILNSFRLVYSVY